MFGWHTVWLSRVLCPAKHLRLFWYNSCQAVDYINLLRNLRNLINVEVGHWSVRETQHTCNISRCSCLSNSRDSASWRQHNLLSAKTVLLSTEKIGIMCVCVVCMVIVCCLRVQHLTLCVVCALIMCCCLSVQHTNWVCTWMKWTKTSRCRLVTFLRYSALKAPKWHRLSR